jgi:hypothetical protein
MARASRRAHWRDARLDNVHLEPRKVLAHCQARHVPPLRPFSYDQGPENHVPLGARDIAHRWAHRRRLKPGARRTGAGAPPVALRATAGRVSFGGVRLPHARHGEPSGGASRTNAPSHRRAASRSGGATSAERDGRPLERRTQCPVGFWSVTVAEGRGRLLWPDWDPMVIADADADAAPDTAAALGSGNDNELGHGLGNAPLASDARSTTV